MRRTMVQKTLTNKQYHHGRDVNTPIETPANYITTLQTSQIILDDATPPSHHTRQI